MAKEDKGATTLLEAAIHVLLLPLSKDHAALWIVPHLALLISCSSSCDASRTRRPLAVRSGQIYVEIAECLGHVSPKILSSGLNHDIVAAELEIESWIREQADIAFCEVPATR